MIDMMVGDNGPVQIPEHREEKQPDKEKNDNPNETASNSSGTEKRNLNLDSKYAAIGWFSVALLLYMLFATLSINDKYVDYGDGNYLYLSWRMTQGDLLYRDIPSPQPPLLLFLGAFLLKLLDGDPTLVRLWQVVQHALTACCIWGITARLMTRPLFCAAAASIYLFLPEGVWWSAGFQSEPLLILLQCINLLLFLSVIREERPGWALYTSAFTAVLCCYTNMTALPYVALQWFFVGYRFRRHFLRYSLSLIMPGLAIFSAMWIYSHGQYIEHVFFRQVGTYPSESFLGTLSYFIGKLYAEGGDILFYEGSFVFASIAGLLLFFSEEDRDPLKEYVLWWAIFSLGSIIFVTKGGTVEYIFTLGEPAVAIFSAYFLLTLFAATDFSLKLRRMTDPIALGKVVLVVCLFLPVLFMKPISLLYRTFSNSALVIPGTVIEKGVYELSDEEMAKASAFIQRHCPPEKTIVAPPYYAFLAKRKLAENSTCLFILSHAYFTEWERLSKSRSLPFDLPNRNEISMWKEGSEQSAAGIQYRLEYNNEGTYYNTQAVYDLAALFAREPVLQMEYPVINMFLRVRKQIMNKEVGLIVKNMKHFFYYVPPLHQAIRDFCGPVDPPLRLDNREEHIVFFKPRY